MELPAGGSEELARITRCEIHVSYEDGGVVLEGLVFTLDPISGSHVCVSKTDGGGSSEIVQSGEPSSSHSLGLVSLSPGTYLASLEIESHGGEVDCSESAPAITAPNSKEESMKASLKSTLGAAVVGARRSHFEGTTSAEGSLTTLI